MIGERLYPIAFAHSGIEHGDIEHELERLGDAMQEGTPDGQKHKEHQRGGVVLLHAIGRDKPAGVAHQHKRYRVGDDHQPKRQMKMDGQPRQQLGEHHGIAAVVDEHAAVVDVVEKLVGRIGEQNTLVGKEHGHDKEHGHAEVSQQEIFTS